MLHFYCLKRIIELFSFISKTICYEKEINSKDKIGCIEIIINQNN